MSAVMDTKRSASRKPTTRRKYSTSALLHDTSPTVSDPIYSCLGQSVVGLYDNIRLGDVGESATNFKQESDSWIKFINFGIDSELLSSAQEKHLLKASLGKGAFNTALLEAAKSIEVNLGKHFEDINTQVQRSLKKHNINIPSHGVAWAKSDWNIDVSFSNSAQMSSFDDAKLDEWKLRFTNYCGVACWRIESFKDAPYTLKVLGGALLEILCMYAEKVHSDHLRQLPSTFNVFDDIEHDMTTEKRREFLKLAQASDVSEKEIIKFLDDNNCEMCEIMDCIGDDTGSAIEKTVEYFQYVDDLDFFNDKRIDNSLSLMERLQCIKVHLETINESQSPLKSHPFLIHLIRLIDISLELFKGSDCIHGISESVSDNDLDSYSVVSVHENDNEYLNNCQEHSMNDGENAVREAHLDDPKALMNAMNNLIVATYLIVSFESFDG